MTVKLLTKKHLEAAQARSSLHLSKCYIVGNHLLRLISYEPWLGISNNVVCATSKASDQPAHTHSLIRAFASHLNVP